MKKIFLLFISCLLFVTACSQSPAPTEFSDEPQEAQDPVNNTGGNFSKEDLIYFIMVDRFNDGDTDNNNFEDVDKNDLTKFHGGDLKGITDKLDYIKSLGSTAIWLTPVFKNEPNGYHGYWASDFYDVDPHFGTMDELNHLVEEAHKKDIKIILDHIVNHTGYNHPWVNDPAKEDWFHPQQDINNWNDQEQVENGWLAGLPDLDQDNPEVRKYLIDNTLWWIDQTGVDGMRLDTMRHVPKDFWEELSRAIKEEYPDFYLLGEVWNSNPRYLDLYHQTGIDGMTNYSLFDGIAGTFTEYGTTSPLINALDKESNFSHPEINGIFLDNHDNKRFMSAAGPNASHYLKQALTFIMTYDAIPIIYYGTEIAMEGGDDPDNRRFMEWDKTDDSEMLSFYKTLVDLRQNNEAIKSGDFQILSYDTKFLSYIKTIDEKSVLIVMNIDKNEKEVVIDTENYSNSFQDILTQNEYIANDNNLSLTLDPFELLILESK